ncbi:hypothetical protein cyc_01935 [Cyclospora cayetanensis]|uniref:Uncharacterized protein n=1 Tax=Cyclospora cayetanensis TaxID=88456 RepID=A0A1D3D4U6_9EIME|nr:hypothetical protein cyc_01935 [Cyclospora cayetanensis]
MSSKTESTTSSSRRRTSPPPLPLAPLADGVESSARGEGGVQSAVTREDAEEDRSHSEGVAVCPISSEGFPAATSTQGKRVEGGDVSMGGLGRRGSWLLLYVRCALEVPSLSAEGAREERGGAPPEAGEASPPRRVGEETATAPPLPLLPLEKEEDPPTDFLLPLEQRRAGVSVQSQLEKASSQGCSTAGDDVQGACVLLFRRMLAVHSDFYADPSGGSSCAGENTLHVERGGVEVGALKRFFLGCVGEGWQGGTSQEGTSREGTSREGTSQGGTSQVEGEETQHRSPLYSPKQRSCLSAILQAFVEQCCRVWMEGGSLTVGRCSDRFSVERLRRLWRERSFAGTHAESLRQHL